MENRPTYEELEKRVEALEKKSVERKQTEEELKFERAQLLSIFGSINQIIYVADPNTYEILYVNDALKNAFEKDPVGGICYKDFQGLDSPCDFCTNEIILKEKPKPYQWEYHNPVLNRDFMIIDRIIKWPDGRHVRFEIAMDVTERKQAEEKYRLLVENANDTIFIAQDGVMKFANPKAEDMTGYSIDELSSVPFIDLIHPEDRDMVQDRHVRRLRGEDLPSTYPFRIISKNGGELWVELNATPITWERRPATLNFLRDITPQKKLEAQFSQAQKMESIGTLAGGIAHDFNNILSAIMGYSELALGDAVKGTHIHKYLQQVMHASHRARDLVKQILAFSRPNVEENKPLKITPIVEEALKLLRASLPTTIEIRRDIETDLGTVLADPSQIHQALMNLCTNAGHAMRDKGGVLEVTLGNVELDSAFIASHPDADTGFYVKLTVRDTGHGMAPDVLERIFEPYFTTKEKGVGTGLGLSVVHGIVKNHGGIITAESESGKGTAFKVYLPFIREQVKKPEVDVEGVLLTGYERILFVDDEQFLVDIGKRSLEHLGYEVVPRTSSIEALELFRNQPDKFDLVITDMTMPNMTGDSLALELMKIRDDIPIILCTGYSERISEGRAKTLGIREFVMKPLVITDLANIIRKVLDRKDEEPGTTT